MSRAVRAAATRPWRRMIAAALIVLASSGLAAAQDADAVGTIEAVVVHGNHTTPTADVLALTGDVIGAAATDEALQAIRDRLEGSGRFAGVDVRKRYPTLDDPSRVLIVVVVDEHDAVSDSDLTPGRLKRLAASGMWSPLLEYQEGYGLTYGARVSFVDGLGPGSRLSVPLSWGGERQAQIEIERSFDGPVAMVGGGGGVHRRRNPHFDLGDSRRLVWGRVESAPRAWLRGGVGARVAAVRFGELDERLTVVGADVTFDTRRDPTFPRNAVYLLAGLERLGFAGRALALPGAEGARSARRSTVDARGYLALVGQAVFALRGQAILASRPLPAFERALLGGNSSLRGWDVGSAAGDNLAGLSAEVLVPLTSPLQQFARLGVKMFADSATTWNAGERLRDQTMRWGYGGGVFLNATVFRFALDLGWRDGRGVPNAHVQLGVRLSR